MSSLLSRVSGETNGVLSSSELSNEDYHSNRTHISSSGLKQLLYSPQMFKSIYVDGFASPPNDGMVLGTFVHALILEPETVKDTFAVFTGAQRRGEAWNSFQEENKSKTIITSSQQEFGLKMLAGFQKSKHGPRLIDGQGKAEDSYFTVLNDVPVKVRLDYFTKNREIIDVKTTSRALLDEEIQKACFSFGYDLSAALYVDVLKKFTGIELPFYFVFVSKEGDCECRTYKASDRFIQNGRTKYLKAMELWKKCMSTGTWESGEPDDIPEIDLP